ncbi:4-coumarate--CoA ligase-like 1 [Dionaea muscipula]
MATAAYCHDRDGEEEYIFRCKYGEVQVPEKVTLPDFVLEDATEELFADKVAFVEAVSGKECTYGQVARDTKRFAKALRSLGLRKGNVVVVVLPNVAEYAIVALGIMAAGGVFSGANPMSHSSEIKHQLDASDAKLIVTNQLIYHKVRDLGIPVIVMGEERIESAMNWDELLGAADRGGGTNVELADHCELAVCQSDVCALPFSSGTTGLSKGVMLTHGNIVANLCSTLFSVDRAGPAGPGPGPGLVVLGLMPFFHIYGITGICCATLRNKGKVVVMPRYELRTFMSALVTHEVTFAPIVPPIILALVKNPIVEQEFDLSRLKLHAIMTAAAPLAPDLRSAFQNKFPAVQIQEAYGLTEHSCITLTHGAPNGEHSKKNSVGFILPNIEVKFIDPDTGRSLPCNTPGEVCVRSPCVMLGYYKNEEETKRTIDSEGWLHTGDIGYVDEDGDLFIVDRIKELIKYKGFQVAPAELEAVLLTHPSVEDAAVVPLPDEEAGEIPAACVVMGRNAKDMSEEDVMKYVASNVSSYKRVRAVYFTDMIPKSPSGKILRRVLRDKILETK